MNEIDQSKSSMILTFLAKLIDFRNVLGLFEKFQEHRLFKEVKLVYNLTLTPN